MRFLFTAALLAISLSSISAAPAGHPHPHPHPHPAPHPQPSPSDPALTTTTSTGSVATTYTTSNTVVVETPRPTTTISGSTETTFTSSGTIYVETTPAASPTTTTTTSSYSGSVTSTFTTGPSSSPTVVVEVPACFDNQTGWEYAYYHQSYSQSEVDFTPAEQYQTRTPDATGTTDMIGFTAPSSNSTEVYDQNLNTTSFALNQRAYLKAPQTGEYTFNFTNVDDRVRLFVGDNAYTGYTDSNEAATYNYDSGADSNGNGVYRTNLTRDSYTPVRVIHYNKNGKSGFGFTLTQPDGTELPLQNILMQGCDPSNVDQAPPFHDFGDEA